MRSMMEKQKDPARTIWRSSTVCQKHLNGTLCGSGAYASYSPISRILHPHHTQESGRPSMKEPQLLNESLAHV
jgi:hypothetical protein